ncbi:hypothetical protein MBLNU457_7286t2 [Dothideomycetes sp. NU457]
MEHLHNEEHNAAVKVISQQVSRFYESKTQFRIYHGSTNSTRPTAFDPSKIVDTSKLKHVWVDTERKVALVEPNVAMDELVDVTLRHGLVPPVVMEFPGITVGGGYAGTSGESSSFKHGFFSDTINWVELVLPDGRICRASPTEHADLFFGAAGSLGTMAVGTLFEVRLVPATKYVEVTYHPVTSVAAAVEKIEECMKDTANDYVDAVLLYTNQGAVVTGRLVDHIPSSVPIQTFHGPWDPWFYLHVYDLTQKTPEPVKEAVPLKDYLFRYDRGGFWTGRYAFFFIVGPFNQFTRWLFDKYLRTRPLYQTLHNSGHADHYIIQDLAIPAARTEDFITYIAEEVHVWPLWLCPLRPCKRSLFNPSLSSADKTAKSKRYLMNIGLWGPGPINYGQCLELNKRLEKKVHEFWKIYDKTKYEALREKYRATYMPTVFDKVKRSGVKVKEIKDEVTSMDIARALYMGFYSTLRTVFSSEYLLKSKRD